MSKLRIQSEVLLSDGKVLDSDATYEIPVSPRFRVTRREILADLRRRIEADLPEGVTVVGIEILRENAPEATP